MTAWCGPDGLPLSWRHYVYGASHLGRSRTVELLRAAQSARAGGAQEKDYTTWRRDLQRAVTPLPPRSEFDG